MPTANENPSGKAGIAAPEASAKTAGGWLRREPEGRASRGGGCGLDSFRRCRRFERGPDEGRSRAGEGPLGAVDDSRNERGERADLGRTVLGRMEVGFVARGPSATVPLVRLDRHPWDPGRGRCVVVAHRRLEERSHGDQRDRELAQRRIHRRRVGAGSRRSQSASGAGGDRPPGTALIRGSPPLHAVFGGHSDNLPLEETE